MVNGLETFANLIVSFFDLIEAEGRTFRERSVLVIEGLLIMFFGAVLVVYGVFAVGAALYFWLSEFIGKPASALLVAAFFLGAGAWMISKGRMISYGKGASRVGTEQKRTDS